MSRRKSNLQGRSAKVDGLSGRDETVRATCARVGGHHGSAPPALAHEAGARDMVGVHMCLQGVHEFEFELAEDRPVPFVLFAHRIDENSFARFGVGEEIGVGGGLGIE